MKRVAELVLFMKFLLENEYTKVRKRYSRFQYPFDISLKVVTFSHGKN